VLRDGKEYEQTLAEVRRLSLRPLEAFHGGEALTESQRSDLREAVRLIEGLIAFQPDKYGPYVLKGMCLRALGEDGAAALALEQGTLQAPASPTPDDRLALARLHDLMAQIHFDRHDYARAERESRRAVELSPEDPDALVTAASVQIQLSRPKEAEGLLRRALKASPGHAKAQSLLKLVRLAGH
jgi:predicted Zn-dependent protease